jgi:membrane-bound lytic murein transglycosylase D
MKLTAALICLSTLAFAQAPQVPHKMQFAGITLTIRDEARREIQKDVDMLTKSPKYMNVKVERAKTYFPIIEKIFEEERVPDDFKYLVLQESALIGDAVSISNAVGFWQFKDFTAIEMGLRVDKEVDERMNIVSSSRAAAKYFKKNNYYFNNWLYALQAYQMGAGGVLQSIKDTESGAKHMEITGKTYWYVKKFLAHKIAYEDAVKGPGALKVITMTTHDRKQFSELAREFAVPENELKAYNKWVLSEFIPGDKPYVVAIPTAGDSKALTEAIARKSKALEPVERVVAKPADAKNETIQINGISAMKARSGETIMGFVKRTDIDLSYFLKCNDLSISDKLMPGEFYYLKKKKSKASTAHHIVQKGENLWAISQKYGVQLRKLYKYNRVESNAVNEGLIVFLSEKKTASAVSQVHDVAEVDAGNAFNWSIEPEILTTSTQSIPTLTLPIEQNIESVTVQDANSRVETMAIRQNEHIVQVGETLYSIAKQYQVGVMDLVEWNNLKLEQGIKPGQALNLRASSLPSTNIEQSPPELIYVVKVSDTLFSVAREHGVTVKEIMDWNQKNDFSLTVGENLKILKKQ